ncbi:thioredoxin family protein [Halobacillus sp. Marseille-Q1614]|uniref:thioredoxin family protein n=1 Tax=Halobacillus sp. Marseille-Q1614 TaxID=2709134 RepID=UPI00156F2BCF|nr:thioredoxin family protein [Halobacillus sp. Marseille-Q1614]
MEPVHTIEEVRTKLQKSPLTLLYISQPGCTVCHSLLPQVEEMMKEFPQINAVHADAQEVKEIAGEFEVFTVPVVILFSEGKELTRMARFVPMGDLHHQLTKYRHFLL